MKLFKDEQNGIYGYESDGSQDHLIPPTYISITNEEAEAIRQSQIVPLTYKELRVLEYPQMSEYLDAIVKGDVILQQKYINDCLLVKAKYPKS